MSTKPNSQQAQGLEKFAADIVHKGGREPSTDRGPGVWDQFAAGVRNGLADFVTRVLLGTTPEPSREPDKGIDR